MSRLRLLPLLLLWLWSEHRTAAVSVTDCPNGQFTTVGSKQYYWSTVKLTFDDAMVECPDNSTLAVFVDSAEMAALASKGNAESERYWTALWNPHKRSCSGTSCNEGLDWVGQKNKVFSEGGVPGSLSVSGGECIAFDGDSAMEATCNTATYHSICQCDSAADPPSDCPPNPMWSKYGSKYYGASLHKMSYTVAKTYCSSHGGKLAQVTTEQEFLQTLTAAVGYQQSMWVDVENPDAEDCSSANACNLKLKNGVGNPIETKTYMENNNDFNFDISPATSAVTCVVLDKAESFTAQACALYRHAFCEASCTAVTSSCPSVSVPLTTIQNDWHFYVSPIPIYHHRARKYCTDLNMDLATFLPRDDYDALEEYLDGITTPTRATWVNWHNPNSENCNDSGCNNKVTDLDMNWLAWENIYYYFPSSYSANRVCAAAEADDGINTYTRLEDKECSAAHEAVCSVTCVNGVDGAWSSWTDVTTCSATTCGAGTKDQTRACDNPSRVLPGADCSGFSSRTIICYAATPCTGCPPIASWTKYGSKWYGFSPMQMTWNGNAQDFCGLYADGAKLASVETPADFNNVVTFMAGTITAWVDLYNPSFAACSSDPSTCDQAFTDKDVASVISVAHMDVLDFSSVSGTQQCVRLKQNLEVSERSCSSSITRALCESSCTPTAPSTCPSTSASLTLVNGKYYHGSDTEYAHYDARKYCTDLNLELASVDTQENYANVAFFIDNHFPQVSYVNLHNPDGITCGDATACNSLLKDFDGNVITTSYFDRDVIVTPPNNTYNCIKIATTAVSRSYCGTGRRVVCELGCVDGDWSDWADNGTCSLTCGGGLQQQDRECNNPYSAGIGADCSGDSVQFLNCNTQGCPVNGSWSDWTDSSPCTVTCGGGEKNQSRACDDPAPANGGLNCTGPDLQTVSCNDQSCPPEYLPWDDWGPCSKTCDYGIRQRHRNCSVPDSCGGLGLNIDTEYCSFSPCPDIVITTPMIPYKVTLTALNQFLAAVTATVTPSGDVMPRVQCTMECLSLRATRHSYTACNGFIYANGLCKLGYKEPNWVVEQSQNPGSEGKIYFDVSLP